MIPTPLLLGFGTGLSLIIAIGAQNAFVLRQGITKQHVWLTVAVCALSDIFLITAGTAGLGILIEQAPWIMSVARIGGAAFLVTYAVVAFRRVIFPDSLTSEKPDRPVSAARVALTALVLTWLNPHVYLDTVLLLGSIGNSFGEQRWTFSIGASLASVVWFAGLGLGAGQLSGLFAKPRAWQLLDGFICVFMMYFAISLIAPLF